MLGLLFSGLTCTTVSSLLCVLLVNTIKYISIVSWRYRLCVNMRLPFAYLSSSEATAVSVLLASTLHEYIKMPIISNDNYPVKL